MSSSLKSPFSLPWSFSISLALTFREEPSSWVLELDVCCCWAWDPATEPTIAKSDWELVFWAWDDCLLLLLELALLFSLFLYFLDDEDAEDVDVCVCPLRFGLLLLLLLAAVAAAAAIAVVFIVMLMLMFVCCCCCWAVDDEFDRCWRSFDPPSTPAPCPLLLECSAPGKWWSCSAVLEDEEETSRLRLPVDVWLPLARPLVSWQAPGVPDPGSTPAANASDEIEIDDKLTWASDGYRKHKRRKN